MNDEIWRFKITCGDIYKDEVCGCTTRSVIPVVKLLPLKKNSNFLLIFKGFPITGCTWLVEIRNSFSELHHTRSPDHSSPPPNYTPCNETVISFGLYHRHRFHRLKDAVKPSVVLRAWSSRVSRKKMAGWTRKFRILFSGIFFFFFKISKFGRQWC